MDLSIGPGIDLLDLVVSPHHVQNRDSLGDSHHHLYPGVNRFENGIGRKRRRHKDHRGIRTLLLHCF